MKKRKKAKGKNKINTRKKGLKVGILIIEIIIVLVLGFVIAMMVIPNSKMKLVKAITSCGPGRGIIGCFLGSDYEEYLQDTDFNEDNIVSNVELSGDFTNFALFGVDAEGVRTDSIIVLSVNNKTGEMKMVSVYRDTVLEYITKNSSGKTVFNYDKANQAYARGGAEGAINMLNVNMDLNIKDYIQVNFDGLANIIDAMGGLDIYIGDNELEYVNAYLADLKNFTGKDSPNVTKSNQIVHLNGLQVTAYCRIRYTYFTNSEGEVFNDDYGRTERQRYVLMELFAKAKNSGAREIMNVTNELFKENSQEDQFIKTSLSMNEILKLVPLLLEFNISGSEGFPFEKSSGSFAPYYVTLNGGTGTLYNQNLSCVFVKDLEKNVKMLHEYLFGSEDYDPTDNVKEIGENLKRSTGVR